MSYSYCDQETYIYSKIAVVLLLFSIIDSVLNTEAQMPASVIF